jgi:transposase
VDRFEAQGMKSLFETGSAKRQRRRLPPAMRRFIVDLKAEYPPLNLNEIANIVYVRFGRELDLSTVQRVLDEEPTPLKMLKRFEPYHEIPEATERRKAIVELHSEGWTVKAIAGYLKTSKPTIYRALHKWIEEGVEGLDDKKRGQKGSVRKVDLKAIEAVRRLQHNPNLGEFRVHAALAQMGIHLSPRTCDRILALNRKLYDLGKPQQPARPQEKKEMPFKAKRRHQYWTADVRYLDHKLGGKIYVISILENHSRAILSSAVSRSQDTISYLCVLYTAVLRYGCPEAIVTDGGGIFRAKQTLSIYEALNIAKEEIDRGQSWQSYIETTFNIQRRMADFYFSRAESWQELVAVHDSWVEAYNHQSHWAHRERKDARRATLEVLEWMSGRRDGPEKLERAFFSTRFARRLDSRGYARFRYWLVYGHEGLAKREAALWLSKENLTIEYEGQLLSRYEVSYIPGSERLREVKSQTLFETPYVLPQGRLFELEETEWLKALKLKEYALLRQPQGPVALQQVLFA